jgi:hypothetical protein
MRIVKISTTLAILLAIIFFSLGPDKASSSDALYTSPPNDQPISTAGSDAELADNSPVSYLMSTSPVRQVVRGVISFGGTEYEVSRNFSPSINPAKSVVLLSKCVEKRTVDPGRYYTLNRNSACLISLTANSITVAVDFSEVSPNIYPQRVSYQIIEYK